MSFAFVERLVVAGLAPGLAAACYMYTPIAVIPEPETRVSVVLSDYGRSEASRQIGPHADRVEGNVVATSDSGYLLAVSGIKTISGNWVKWTGETVSVRRDFVASTYRRDLSKPRTALLAAGAAAALTAVIVGFDLFGLGSPPSDNGGGDPPGES